MKKHKDLIRTPEYWLETIQNELYRELKNYMIRHNKTQNEVAKDLNVSKSYISQILNGNFNFTLKKLIELSLYFGKMPLIHFLTPDKVIHEEKSKVESVKVINWVSGHNPGKLKVNIR